MQIFNLIQQIKDEAEKLEPSRKEQLLDMIDSFEASVKHILDPKGNEPTEQELEDGREIDRLKDE